MRMMFAAAAALSLAACATAPPRNELQLAQEVFELSGGFSEARQIVSLGVPFALSEIDDVGDRCRRSAGSGPLAAAACEIAVAALRSAQSDRTNLTRALDRQLTSLEGKAAQALVDTYSYDELAAMRRFYSTPEGRSIVSKRAQFWSAMLKG